ncbi:MAG: UDP-3-O-(3-hydroxymyristoyl)glucosamine N-acyltransferase [Planctomycetota bacterium]
MAEMTLGELAEAVGGQLQGDAARTVRGMASLESADSTEAAFLANARYRKHMADTSAAAVIVPADYDGPIADSAALIRCEDPYFAFREAMVALYGFAEPEFSDVDERADIDTSAELDDDVAVGPFATIRNGVSIGERTVIYPGAYIGPHCRIGEDCTIGPNVALYHGTIVGNRVSIAAGSSIGQDGFGYATHAGKHHKIPQVGWVEIGDDVEIGACCAIERGTLGATRIGSGTKMADLIGIGHAAQLGEHCLMVSQSGIAGSVTTGDYCVLAGQAGVANHVHLGDRVRLAAQSGVAHDVDSDQDLFGSPAMPLARARRALGTLPQLPEMRKALKRLEQEIAELKRRFVGDDEHGSGST